MAPKGEATKATPKVVQRSVAKTLTKTRSSPIGVKKTIPVNDRKKIERIPFKMNNTVESRQRTSTVPKVNTPKPKENKASSVPPGSTTKSAKKLAWKRRPKPAHSGVPVPEKMKALMQKQFKDLDDNF